MFKKSSKVLAAVLAAAMVFTGAAVGATGSSVDAQAAAKTKVSMVTKASNNDGDSIKYTYNKKGLLTKSVATSSYKTSGEVDYTHYNHKSATDVTETTTTKYTYNKKGFVTSKDIVTVTATTYYNMDLTTGQTVKGTEGTVTHTETENHTYSVNKKGAVTKDVVTTYDTYSGGRTITAYNSTKYDKDMTVADYVYNDDGDYVKVYYSNDLTVTNTYTDAVVYTDNGNGTYNISKTTTYTKPNTNKTAVKDEKTGYTTGYTIDLTGTSNEYKTEQTDTVSNKKTETIEYSLNAKRKPTGDSNTTVIEEKDDQSVTYSITEYTTDSVWLKTYVDSSKVTLYDTTGTYFPVGYTTVNGTMHSVYEDSTGYYYYSDESVPVTIKTTSNHTEKNSTNNNTTQVYKDTFSYNKNGTLKKSVNSTDGIVTGTKLTSVEYDKGSQTTVTTIDSTGVEYSKTETPYRYRNGYYENPYTYENYKIVDTFAGGYETITYSDDYEHSWTYNSSTNAYDENITAVANVATTKVKIAEPSKYTTTYKYDKAGNYVSSKTSGTYSAVVDVYDDATGLVTYTYDANKAKTNNEILKTTSVKKTVKNEITLDKSETRISEKLTTGTNLKDREASSGYELLGQISYKIKAKKVPKKLASTVEAQQWIIQNGNLTNSIGIF